MTRAHRKGEATTAATLWVPDGLFDVEVLAVLRRWDLNAVLSRAEVVQLVGQYRLGDSIDTLSRRYEIHRTTVMHHLDQSDVAQRTVVRKMSDETVALAAAQYDQGASLAVVAGAFGLHQRTLARELRRAGVATRPRRGWRP